MEDKTTTETSVSDGGNVIHGVVVDDQGSAIPQPEQQDQVEAVEPTSDQPSQEAPKEDEPVSTDNSASEWLKKKGIDPTSPEAIEKVAEMARNAEKAMHQKAQKASELEKSVQFKQEDIPVDADQSTIDTARVRNIELKQQLTDWRLANPDKRAEEESMTQLLVDDPNLTAMVREGYLDFDKLHAMAKGLNSDVAKSQGKREALENLAQRQQASVPTGNAVTSSGGNRNTITPQNVDQMVANMSIEEYRRRLPEINAALGA